MKVIEEVKPKYGLPYRKFNCPVCKHFNIVSEKVFIIKED